MLCLMILSLANTTTSLSLSKKQGYTSTSKTHFLLHATPLGGFESTLLKGIISNTSILDTTSKINSAGEDSIQVLVLDYFDFFFFFLRDYWRAFSSLPIIFWFQHDLVLQMAEWYNIKSSRTILICSKYIDSSSILVVEEFVVLNNSVVF